MRGGKRDSAAIPPRVLDHLREPFIPAGIESAEFIDVRLQPATRTRPCFSGFNPMTLVLIPVRKSGCVQSFPSRMTNSFCPPKVHRNSRPHSEMRLTLPHTHRGRNFFIWRSSLFTFFVPNRMIANLLTISMHIRSSTLTFFAPFARRLVPV